MEILKAFSIYVAILYFGVSSTAGLKGRNYAHSSIILYQGSTRHELDAKDCPVGVGFKRPVKFSCACINGIWAFYDNPCLAPIAIVGGHNHCFQMPKNPISMAIVISNPLRALGDSVTVFEEDMESIHTKVYRNARIRMTNIDQFITMNSSWTLTSPDGSKSVCLENRAPAKEVMDSLETPIDGPTYCSYADVQSEIPFIGSVVKGCNDSIILEPVVCQSTLPENGEDMCLETEVLEGYTETDIELNPIFADDLDDELTSARLARALENLGRFDSPITPTTTTKTTTSTTPEPTTEKYSSAYQAEPTWHQRWVAAKGPEYFEEPKSGGPQGRSMSSKVAAPAASQPAPAIPIDDLWKNPHTFLENGPSESNKLVTNHLWMFHRMAIRNILNITRLVPPDEAMAVEIDTGKVKKLLTVHTSIMKRICPLVPEPLFDILTGTFMGLLTKAIRWKEPYVEQTHFLRILTSLTMCKDNAAEMKFKPLETCSHKGSDHIMLPDKDGAGTVTVKLEIPEVFRSSMFEPVIESVWKTFISVHSYCFKDFSDQYQDHHKYTTLMMGLFTNPLHDIWVRNMTIAYEYSGVLGDVSQIMQELERCATGARMTSEYPFHMNRPTKLARYNEDSPSITSNKGRKKRDLPDSYDLEGRLLQDAPHIRRKRLTTNGVGENMGKKLVLGGKGICLKKYSDSRTIIGRKCPGK